MTLSEIFTEARKAATKATIRALRGFGYELDELATIPASELENAFEYGDEAGWKVLNSLGAYSIQNGLLTKTGRKRLMHLSKSIMQKTQ